MKRMMIGLISMASALAILSGMVQPSAESIRPPHDQQLRALIPDQPGGYLELGEWILLNDSTGKSRSMGIELLVRAVLWGGQKGQPMIASSACIAMSELVDDDRSKDMLWDLALLLDPSREAEWLGMLKKRSQNEASLGEQASSCLYAIRYHQQPIGRELFSDPKVRARIFEASDLAGINQERLEAVIYQEIDRGLEDPCRGRLYVVDRGQRGDRLVCPDHLRALGMCANDAELRLFLQVEMVLAGAEAGSWRAAESMSMDGAVSLPTIADLVNMMGAEPTKAYYRDGQWVTMP